VSQSRNDEEILPKSVGDDTRDKNEIVEEMQKDGKLVKYSIRQQDEEQMLAISHTSSEPTEPVVPQDSPAADAVPDPETELTNTEQSPEIGEQTPKVFENQTELEHQELAEEPRDELAEAEHNISNDSVTVPQTPTDKQTDDTSPPVTFRGRI